MELLVQRHLPRVKIPYAIRSSEQPFTAAVPRIKAALAADVFSASRTHLTTPPSAQVPTSWAGRFMDAVFTHYDNFLFPRKPLV